MQQLFKALVFSETIQKSLTISSLDELEQSLLEGDLHRWILLCLEKGSSGTLIAALHKFVVFATGKLSEAVEFIRDQHPYAVLVQQPEVEIEESIQLYFPGNLWSQMEVRPLLCIKDPSGGKFIVKGEFIHHSGEAAWEFFESYPIPRHFASSTSIQSPLEEPSWLRSAINGCFQVPADLHRKQSEIFSEHLDATIWEPIVNRWDFESQNLDHSDCLRAVWYMFTSLGLVGELNVDGEALQQFFLVIEHNYRENPYHNFNHAVDVMQCVYFVLRNAPELQNSGDSSNVVLSSLTRFGLLLAAICHDVGHTGLNNRFMVKDQSDLALLYNNRSVLENLHAMLIFAILRRPGSNFMASWRPEDRTGLRQTILQCVLATDMDSHAELLERIRLTFPSRPLPTDGLLSENDQNVLAIALIKCADLCNTCRPFPVARRWGLCLMDEFYQIGDHEASLGWDVSPMFDRRNRHRLPLDQVFFLSRIARPLFQLVADMLPGIAYTLNYLDENIENWRKFEQ